MTVVSAQDFNRNVAAAKRAAADGPVFVTSRGKATHVLLSIDEYRRTYPKRSVHSAARPTWLSDPADGLELELPARDLPPKAVEF
ncbi:MAG: type II toxin-antitoxin system Phd/YefM family antitoxin [Bifidobacteriaceae bacterium]|nr:type II toxin-antitoxin system Phd/YefM family antitoxin [Bifidobacteriaceae bacterium]